jgi:phage tail sheath protein FI
MPLTLNYPGVYIEELSSGVHTITGVATSIAAFAGWATQGPLDEAVLVESWSDFVAQFGGTTGGLSNYNGTPNYLGYAVNQFFANGGSQAYIIRVVWPPSPQTPALAPASGTSPTAPAWATASVAGLPTFYASSPGLWANGYAVNLIPNVPSTGRFTLQTLDPTGNVLENFPNLSTTASDSQYVVAIINSDSDYVTFVNPASPSAAITLPAAPLPGAITSVSLANGLDGSTLVPGDGNFELALGDLGDPAADNYGISLLLNQVAIFNLLCVPGETVPATIAALQGYCVNKRAFLIVDSPQTATAANLFNAGGPGSTIQGTNATNSAYYFPWVLAPDPLAGNRPALFPPCGFVAGIYAATDASRGVWKAPAGIAANLSGALGLQYNLTNAEDGNLNPLAINCLREFRTYGDVVWGCRTLAGSSNAGSQWQYIPIRRLALYIESSLYEGTQWVVFEPNDEPLWSQIRLNVGSFMQELFLQGAFQGTSAQQAYFVKCDSENNPQSSIDQGIVSILVGFAPLYPAEFVVIQIQQIAVQS